jgi:hypothetical protein
MALSDLKGNERSRRSVSLIELRKWKSLDFTISHIPIPIFWLPRILTEFGKDIVAKATNT